MGTWTDRPLENPLRNWFKGKRGLEHNLSKPVITPVGVFRSCALAAEDTAWPKSRCGIRPIAAAPAFATISCGSDRAALPMTYRRDKHATS